MKNLRKLFGTDGIRGVANVDLTPEFAVKVGRAGAIYLVKDLSNDKSLTNNNNKRNSNINRNTSSTNNSNSYNKDSSRNIIGNGNSSNRILVGRDTRPSGDFLSKALISGILASGVDVLDAEIITTPAVALLVKILKLDGGVVISASHNPVDDNGIKFFGKNGQKLTDFQEHAIEKYILGEAVDSKLNPSGISVGRSIVLNDAYEIYLNYIKNFFKLNLNGIKIALDCANGASSILAPLVFKNFGANVIVFNDDISGVLINKDCGATHPEFISAATVKSNADFGIAFDGDADRVIICDRFGKIIDGDIIIGICALDMKNKSTLSNNCIVTTVMANMGLEKTMVENNIVVYKTNVGDRYVLEKMVQTGSVIGGEQSGHIIFKNISPTGDGIISALEFLNVVINNNYDSSTIFSLIPKFPQVLKNVKVADKNKIMDSFELKDTVSKVEQKLSDKGRILVRSSGTEMLIRVMAEAEEEKTANEAVDEIVNVINKLNNK